MHALTHVWWEDLQLFVVHEVEVPWEGLVFWGHVLVFYLNERLGLVWLTTSLISSDHETERCHNCSGAPCKLGLPLYKENLLLLDFVNFHCGKWDSLPDCAAEFSARVFGLKPLIRDLLRELDLKRKLVIGGRTRDHVGLVALESVTEGFGARAT